MGVYRSIWEVKNEEIVRVGRESGKGKVRKCLERMMRKEVKKSLTVGRDMKRKNVTVNI